MTRTGSWRRKFLGLALGIGTGHLMSAALFGVQAADPIAVGISIALVLLVAWVAAVVPARGAGRLSPTTGRVSGPARQSSST